MSYTEDSCLLILLFVLSSYLDHIVITAPDLEAGASRVEAALGVSLAPGGSHPEMGTHNRLLRLSDSTYLEVIAPDPAADAQLPRPRWFNLDYMAADEQPLLAGWVARCDDIYTTLTNCEDEVGGLQTMTRGNLAWRIAVRSDGALPLDGAAPALIEWETPIHPAATLPDAGCSLIELRLYHPDPELVYGILTNMDMQSRPTVHWSGDEPAHLVAIINTPAGQRTLKGRI